MLAIQFRIHGLERRELVALHHRPFGVSEECAARIVLADGADAWVFSCAHLEVAIAFLLFRLCLHVIILLIANPCSQRNNLRIRIQRIKRMQSSGNINATDIPLSSEHNQCCAFTPLVQLASRIAAKNNDLHTDLSERSGETD